MRWEGRGGRDEVGGVRWETSSLESLMKSCLEFYISKECWYSK